VADAGRALAPAPGGLGRASSGVRPAATDLPPATSSSPRWMAREPISSPAGSRPLASDQQPDRHHPRAQPPRPRWWAGCWPDRVGHARARRSASSGPTLNSAPGPGPETGTSSAPHLGRGWGRAR